MLRTENFTPLIMQQCSDLTRHGLKTDIFIENSTALACNKNPQDVLRISRTLVEHLCATLLDKIHLKHAPTLGQSMVRLRRCKDYNKDLIELLYVNMTFIREYGNRASHDTDVEFTSLDSAAIAVAAVRCTDITIKLLDQLASTASSLSANKSDTEPPLSKTVWVGNLPEKTTVEQLRNVAGDCESCFVKGPGPDPKMWFGFVNAKTPEQATKIRDKLNRTIVGGIRLDARIKVYHN